MSQQYSPYVSFLNSATLDDRISIIQDSPKCPNVYFSDLQSFIFLSYHFHITHTTTFKIQFTFQFLCYYFNMSFDIPFLLLICLIFVASHFYLLLLSNPIHLFYLLHNKHFIRHHISQNKVLIIPKSLSFLPRQTGFNASRPVTNSCIRILHLPPDRLRPSPQIRLHLLPIQIRIIPHNDPPLH